MNHLVSGGMLFLAVTIALIEPAPDVHKEVAEHTVLPGVTYRVERHWRMVPDEVIAQQAENELAAILQLRPLISHTKGSWWITRRWKEIRIAIRDWFADQRHRSRLIGYYRDIPTNWYLSDLGIARNGKPLPVPPDLAASLWREHAMRDHWARRWADSLISSPSDAYLNTHGLTLKFDDEPIDDLIIEQIDAAAAEARGSDLDARVLFPNAIDFDAHHRIEEVYLAPYLLLIRDGTLIGVLGGNGHFDRIPAGWEYLRRMPDSPPSP